MHHGEDACGEDEERHHGPCGWAAVHEASVEGFPAVDFARGVEHSALSHLALGQNIPYKGKHVIPPGLFPVRGNPVRMR